MSFAFFCLHCTATIHQAFIHYFLQADPDCLQAVLDPPWTERHAMSFCKLIKLNCTVCFICKMKKIVLKSIVLFDIWLSGPPHHLTWESWSTFSCPGPEGAVVINNVVESQGDDEEGAVTGRVHLERHIALVQPHRLALLCQGRLKQLPRHLGAKMESVNVAKRLQKVSCNQKAPGLIPATAIIFIRSDVFLSVALTDMPSYQLH